MSAFPSVRHARLNTRVSGWGVHTRQVPCGVGAPVSANRGASGIDGVLSAAAGFAFGLARCSFSGC